MAVQRADVVGLQEVWTERGADPAEILTDRLRRHHVLVPSPEPVQWQQRLTSAHLFTRSGEQVGGLARR